MCRVKNKNKSINVIGLEFDVASADLDGDHLGAILVDSLNKCIQSLDDTCINIIKLDVGNASIDKVPNIVLTFRKMFKKRHLKHCILVPISDKCGIKDIKLDKVEVVHHT